MTVYRYGQNVKIKLFNKFHNTSTVVKAKILTFESNFWIVEMPQAEIVKAEKELCKISACICQKITAAALFIDETKKVHIRKAPTLEEVKNYQTAEERFLQRLI